LYYIGLRTDIVRLSADRPEAIGKRSLGGAPPAALVITQITLLCALHAKSADRWLHTYRALASAPKFGADHGVWPASCGDSIRSPNGNGY